MEKQKLREAKRFIQDDGDDAQDLASDLPDSRACVVLHTGLESERM